MFARAIHDETRAIGGGSATTTEVMRAIHDGRAQAARLRRAIEAMVESAGHRAARRVAAAPDRPRWRTAWRTAWRVGVAHGVAEGRVIGECDSFGVGLDRLPVYGAERVSSSSSLP